MSSTLTVPDILKYGFYNYNPNDTGEEAKTYSAEDFNNLLSGVITEGACRLSSVGPGDSIYAAGGSLKLYNQTYLPGQTMLSISEGKAFILGTWNNILDSVIGFIPSKPTIYNRIDALVLFVDTISRHNEIRWVLGNESSTPTKPTLTKNSLRYEFAIAYVTRYTTEQEPTPFNPYIQIPDSSIENVVGTEESPYISGISGTCEWLHAVLEADANSLTFSNLDASKYYNSMIQIFTSNPGVRYEDIYWDVYPNNLVNLHIAFYGTRPYATDVYIKFTKESFNLSEPLYASNFYSSF